LVEIADLIRYIPPSQTNPLEKKVIDIILKSKNAPLLSDRLAKSILNLYHADRLSSPEGLQILLDASISLEREKTVEALQELGLTGAVKALSGG